MALPGEPAWHGFFRLGHMGHVNGHMIMGLLGGIEAGPGRHSMLPSVKELRNGEQILESLVWVLLDRGTGEDPCPGPVATVAPGGVVAFGMLLFRMAGVVDET